jgi:D-alanine transfer protein
MKKPVFGPLITAVLIALILLLVPVSLFAPFIPAEDLVDVAPSPDLKRFKNLFLEEGALSQDGFLPLFGSSTIGFFSRYHPSNYFLPDEWTPYLVGQPGCTDLLHVLNLAAVGPTLAHRKLVIMLDPSEFMIPNGISDAGFTRFYSPLTGYRFVFSKDIPEAEKKKIAHRLLHYTAVKSDPLLVTMLEGMTLQEPQKEWKAALLKPAAYLRLKLLEKQDFIESFTLLKTNKPFHRLPVARNLTWDKLREQAAEEAKKETNNNPYGFLNDVYLKTVHEKHAAYKNSWRPGSPGSHLQSVTYDDLQAILDILKNEQAEPIFVLIPRKGAWCDYIGFTRPYREQLYAKIRKQVQAAGFPMLDYSRYEYDNYFMRDPAHLGWTGWVTLDQDLDAYVKGENG